MKRLCIVILLIAATSSASTKLKASWKNPNYAGQRFKKILVIGMSNKLETRADFEVALASKITRPGIGGIAGTDILLRPILDFAESLVDDVESKEALKLYYADEMSSATWLRAMCRKLTDEASVPRAA